MRTHRRKLDLVLDLDETIFTQDLSRINNTNVTSIKMQKHGEINYFLNPLALQKSRMKALLERHIDNGGDIYVMTAGTYHQEYIKQFFKLAYGNKVADKIIETDANGNSKIYTDTRNHYNKQGIVRKAEIIKELSQNNPDKNFFLVDNCPSM